jgi:hypothetical protein
MIENSYISIVYETQTNKSIISITIEVCVFATQANCAGLGGKKWIYHSFASPLRRAKMVAWVRSETSSLAKMELT